MNDVHVKLLKKKKEEEENNVVLFFVCMPGMPARPGMLVLYAWYA